MVAFSTAVGSLGVTLLLVGFFLNLFRLLRADAYAYILLNVVGGGLSCYASYLIGYLPFVVLEGTWALVAAVALVRRWRRGPADPTAARPAAH